MRTLIIPASLVAAAMAFTACEKSTSPGAGSGPDVLYGKKWKLTAEAWSPPISFLGITIGDIYATLEDCDKDNFVTYSANGTSVLDEGPTKCDPDNPQTTSSKWTLSADGKTMTTTGDGQTHSVAMDVVTMNASTLTLAITSSDFEDGKSHTLTTTMKAQ